VRGSRQRATKRHSTRLSRARVFPLTAPFLSPPPEFQCMFWPGLGPQDKKPGLRPLTSGLQSTYQTVARGEHGCNNRGAAGRNTMASHMCPMNSTACRPCCSALSSPDVSLPFGSLAHLCVSDAPDHPVIIRSCARSLTISLNKSYFYLSIVVGSSSQYPCLAAALFSPACDQAAPETDKRNCKGLCARKAKETKRMISGISP
jgi:hypothetical protein